jgi:hypothetical protein
MKNCPKCGYCEKEVDESEDLPMEESDDTSAKSEVLKELMEMMSGSLGNRLSKIKKKPEGGLLDEEEEEEK